MDDETGEVAGPGGLHGWSDHLAQLSRLELLANNAGDYTALAVDGVIEWVSPSVSALLGWMPAELIGRDSTALIHPDDRDLVRAVRLDLDRAGPQKLRLRMSCKDGTWRWVESRSRRAVDEAGRPTSAMVSSVWDVQTEVDALDRLAASEAALAEMEAMARHTSKLESLGVLAGGVAHDFNNLLTAVMAYAELIAQQAADGATDPAAILRDARAIVRSAERGAALTAQLLAFARQERSGAEVVEIDAVVASTVELMYRTLGGGVVVESRLGAAGATVLIDRGLFEQAMINVAVNARDAMPDGGRLLVTTAPSTHVPHHVRVAFVDEGCGMEASVAARAFDPFFTTKPVGAGTGLGLSSVYGVITGAGGTIGIDTAPGRGTTVVIELPTTSAGDTGAAGTGTAIRAPAVAAGRRGGDQ